MKTPCDYFTGRFLLYNDIGGYGIFAEHQYFRNRVHRSLRRCARKGCSFRDGVWRTPI